MYLGKRRRHDGNYPCIPLWQRSQVRDDFDYELRAPVEVAEQHKYFPPDFNIQCEYKRYYAGDTREHVDTKYTNLDNRDTIAKINFDLRELKLSPLQRSRFVYLMGPRYNPQFPHKMKIVTKQYNTFNENFERSFEILREIYWEALRAPSNWETAVRNPYRGEKIKKKILGNTKEERDAKTIEIKEKYKLFMENRENEIIEEERAENEKNMSIRAKRRVQQAKRVKLGFEPHTDDSTLPPMDPVLEQIPITKEIAARAVKDIQARGNLRVPKEVSGLSKSEQEAELLKSDEMFKEAE